MTLDEEMLDAIRAEARGLLSEFGTHGFEHTERVCRACRRLGGGVGADLSVLLPAALLHDVGRRTADHALDSAEIARRILEALGYEWDKVEAVVEAISTHSFTGGRSSASLEARVLSDADKLDATGALGIYRAAMYSLEHGRPIGDFIAHFHEKLLKLKDRLFTEEARRLAESRHRFMLDFLSQLDRELNLEA